MHEAVATNNPPMHSGTGKNNAVSSLSKEEGLLNVNFNGFQAIALLNTDLYLSSSRLTVH